MNFVLLALFFFSRILSYLTFSERISRAEDGSFHVHAVLATSLLKRPDVLRPRLRLGVRRHAASRLRGADGVVFFVS